MKIWPDQIATKVKELTIYHRKMTFDAPEIKKKIAKTMQEKEEMLVTSIFSFSHNVLSHPKEIAPFEPQLKLSSANAFNFGMIKRLKNMLFLLGNRTTWCSNNMQNLLYKHRA